MQHHRLKPLLKELEPKLVLKLAVREYRLAQEQVTAASLQEPTTSLEELASILVLVPGTLGPVTTEVSLFQGQAAVTTVDNEQ